MPGKGAHQITPTILRPAVYHVKAVPPRAGPHLSRHTGTFLSRPRHWPHAGANERPRKCRVLRFIHSCLPCYTFPSAQNQSGTPAVASGAGTESSFLSHFALSPSPLPNFLLAPVPLPTLASFRFCLSLKTQCSFHLQDQVEYSSFVILDWHLAHSANCSSLTRPFSPSQLR